MPHHAVTTAARKQYAYVRRRSSQFPSLYSAMPKLGSLEYRLITREPYGTAFFDALPKLGSLEGVGSVEEAFARSPSACLLADAPVLVSRSCGNSPTGLEPGKSWSLCHPPLEPLPGVVLLDDGLPEMGLRPLSGEVCLPFPLPFASACPPCAPSARGQHKSQQRTGARTCCGRGGVVLSSAAKATTSDSSTLSAVTAAVAFVGFELVAFVFLSPALDGLDLLPLPKPAEILPPAMPLVRCPRSGAGNGHACTTHAWTLRPCRAASGPL